MCPFTSACFILCWMNLADLSLKRLPTADILKSTVREGSQQCSGGLKLTSLFKLSWTQYATFDFVLMKQIFLVACADDLTRRESRPSQH